MATSSTGHTPPRVVFADANQAVAVLSALHHWRATKVKRSDDVARYQVTITHAGKRASSTRYSFVDAANSAYFKLFDQKHGVSLRLAR